ncbi:3-keto-disaccharide hydrolase [Paludibaculum fermentans]|uniref:3-keto-disaccharide hydrolase n=1 Tax=Paludibaculum fermentans TaxID=1473598 RepID=UPI003EBD7347
MRTALLLVLLAGLATAADAVKPTKRIKLFNGKDLTNFYTFLKDSHREDPKKVFTVANGMIHISGAEWGAVTTEKEYRDYHLIVEWKWGQENLAPRVGKARDSGILLHGTGVDGAAGSGWLESIEYQMIEGGTGDMLMVKGAAKPKMTVEAITKEDKQLYWEQGAPRVTRDSGRVNWYGRDIKWTDTFGYRGPVDVEKPVGQWNRSEVIAEGGHLVYYLNGVKVNEGFDGDHTQGKIQVQSEAAEVYIRKIELAPVKGGAKK